MSKLLIRIEVHRENNYEQLHAALAKRGVKRLIEGSNNLVYKLPTGTYYYNGGSEIATVHAAVMAAAAEAGHRNPQVIIADAHSCMWQGLEVASAHEQRMGA